MSDMILYPTDDEIDALNAAITYNENRGIIERINSSPSPELSAEFLISTVVTTLLAVILYECIKGRKVLRINESVLG